MKTKILNINKDIKKYIKKWKSKNIVFVFDKNTRVYADQIKKQYELTTKDVYFNNKNLVPDNNVVAEVINKSSDSDLLLCVGSGSLNDVCKYAAKINKVKYAIFPSACSMDGYLSKGSALMIDKKKVTLESTPPIAVFLDSSIYQKAPREMTASGFGDVIGKYTALMDWKFSNLINNEKINKKAYKMMEIALKDVVESYNNLSLNKNEALDKLMNALLIAGTSMAVCGNSRPASGSEHHISHYLEMDFNKKGLPIPPHGVKVAMGCLVSLELYRYLSTLELSCKNEVSELVKTLPSTEEVEFMLQKVGCPTKFSSLGIDRALFKETLLNAYTVRDRFTILTFFNNNKLWTDDLINVMIEKFY